MLQWQAWSSLLSHLLLCLSYFLSVVIVCPLLAPSEWNHPVCVLPSLQTFYNLKFIISSTVLELVLLWQLHQTKLPHLICKGKAVPLQAWSGPECSRKLRFPDFMTTAQEVGNVVSLTHWPHLPQEILLVLISVRGWVNLAIGRMSMKNSNDTT